MAFVTKGELDKMADEIIERDGIGKIKESDAYKELEAELKKVWQENEARKAREARRWMKAIDISADAKISISVSYKIIRELAKELQAKGYFTNRGIISRSYLCERYYCDDEPHPFMDIEDIMDALPVSRSEGYVVIRELNQIVLEEKGCRVIRGRTSRKIFREKFYGVEVADAG